jgi:hypothetical protein
MAKVSRIAALRDLFKNTLEEGADATNAGPLMVVLVEMVGLGLLFMNVLVSIALLLWLAIRGRRVGRA